MADQAAGWASAKKTKNINKLAVDVRVDFKAEDEEDAALKQEDHTPSSPMRVPRHGVMGMSPKRSREEAAAGTQASKPEAGTSTRQASRTYADSILGKLATRLCANAVKSAEEVENLRSGLAWLSIVVGDGDGKGAPSPVIQTGSACSGTEIYVLFMEALLEEMQRRFEFDQVSIDPLFACDNDQTRRDFIKHQFPELELMIPDCKCFLTMERQGSVFTAVKNEFSQGSARVPRVRVFCSGFSCKSVSNQNKNRKSNTGCIKAGKGSTGETFWAIFEYIRNFRPQLMVLENVPNLAQEVSLENGSLESDLDHIIEAFNREQFYCISFVMDRLDYGSPQRGKRLWIVAFDFLPRTGEHHRIKDRVAAQLGRFVEPEPHAIFPVECIMVDDDELETIGAESSARKPKHGEPSTPWYPVHQETIFAIAIHPKRKYRFRSFLRSFSLPPLPSVALS